MPNKLTSYNFSEIRIFFDNVEVFPSLLGSNFSIVLLGTLLLLQTSQKIQRQRTRRKKVSRNPIHSSSTTMMITSSNLISSMIGMETTLMVLKTQKKNQLKIQKMLRTSAKAEKVLEMKSKMI